MKKRIMSTILLVALIFCMIPTNIAFASDKKGTWKHNKKGWWYEYSDGSFAKDEFVTISGKKYYFNKYGYMVTGWKTIGYYVEDNYHYLDLDNTIHYTGNKNKIWYYFHADGTLACDEYVNGYYVPTGYKYYDDESSGKWAWKKYVYEDNHWEWRYVNLKTHNYMSGRDWIKIDNKYYFFASDGSLYGNFYIGNNEDGFYWVDKNGTWSYKAKLSQLDSGEYISSKDRMFGKYKDTRGFIPKGKYVFINNGYYELVTFDSSGKVTNSRKLEGYHNGFFWYDEYTTKLGYCMYKLNINSSGLVTNIIQIDPLTNKPI